MLLSLCMPDCQTMADHLVQLIRALMHLSFGAPFIKRTADWSTCTLEASTLSL